MTLQFSTAHSMSARRSKSFSHALNAYYFLLIKLNVLCAIVFGKNPLCVRKIGIDCNVNIIIMTS